MPKLTDTQLVVLAAAARQPDRLAALPKLPAAAQAAVGRSLLKARLLTTVPLPAARTAFAWKLDRDTTTGLRITDAGLAAIGVEPEAPIALAEQAPQAEPAEPVQADVAMPVAAPRASMRELATAVLAAWDTDRDALAGAVDALRAALAKPARTSGAPRTARNGSKQEAVLSMLRREEGATIAQIIDATAWQPHTVRGFLAGLKRKGIHVSVLERVRQVRPNREGAKGSYSVYRANVVQGDAGTHTPAASRSQTSKSPV